MKIRVQLGEYVVEAEADTINGIEALLYLAERRYGGRVLPIPSQEAIEQTVRHVESHPPFVGEAGPDDDEVVPFSPPDPRLDLTQAQAWRHRSRRNVLMEVGGGVRSLVWARGAAIPPEEARRQGVDWYVEPCEKCQGTGFIYLSGSVYGDKEVCQICDGKTKLRVDELTGEKVPWVDPRPGLPF